jgi:hypothetical protein
MAERKKPKGLLDAVYNVGSGIASDLGTMADWFADSYQDPSAALKQAKDAVVGAAKHTAQIPQKALEASETMRTQGVYNPEPVVEAAQLPMGIGLAGVPMKAGEAALGAGVIRPVTGGYHATANQEIFDKFKKTGNDIGTHMSIDPNIAGLYPFTMEKGMTLTTSAPRTMPVVGDFNNPLRYPLNPAVWNDPDMVVNNLALRREWGGRIPKNLVDDFERAAKAPGKWEDNFFGMLRDRGHDSVQYPHSANTSRYDSFMALNPEQVVPRFSEQGQQWIKERGIKEPMKRYNLEDVMNNVAGTTDQRTLDELFKYYPHMIPND